MSYFARSSWTDEPKSATKLAGTGRTQTEIYIHYPGQIWSIGCAPVNLQKVRLRGYLRQHVKGNGWADIAYNLAVDQAGNIYELRGIDRQCGANGGTVSNRRGQAILVLVGNSEMPTIECIAGIQEAIGRIRKEHPKALTIRGHQDSPEASTACPGSHLMRLVRSGALEPRKAAPAVPAIPAGGTSVPAPRPQAQPAKPATAAKLDEDGRWGTDTTKALQRFLNSHVPGAKLDVDGRAGRDTWIILAKFLNAPYRDGKVSRQSYRATELGNGIVPSTWEYTGRGSSGSQLIQKLQTWVGVKADGIAFEGTTKALQRKLNALGATK